MVREYSLRHFLLGGLMVAKAQKQSEASEIWEQMCFTLAVSAMLGRKGGNLSVGNISCMS